MKRRKIARENGNCIQTPKPYDNNKTAQWLYAVYAINVGGQVGVGGNYFFFLYFLYFEYDFNTLKFSGTGHQNGELKLVPKNRYV